MLNIITDIQHMHAAHRHGSVSITILCFCATADSNFFSLAKYIAYEQSQTLELVLESSRKAEVGYELLVQLQDGSATCKFNILKMLLSNKLMLDKGNNVLHPKLNAIFNNRFVR